MEGDDHLCIHENKLWACTYYILEKFHVPVQFRWDRARPQYGIDNSVSWFIPDVSEYNKVHQFIYQEFKDDISIGHWKEVKYSLGVNDGTPIREYVPGTSLHIYKFSGAYSYATRAESKELADYYLKFINKKFRKETPFYYALHRITVWVSNLFNK